MNPEEMNPNYSKKKIIIVAVCIVIVVLAILIQYSRNTNPGGLQKPLDKRQEAPPAKSQLPKAPTVNGSSLLFDQKEKTVSKGDEFTLVANIDPVKNKISAIELHFSYDQKVLKLESMAKATSFGTELSPAKIDDKAGTAWITLGADLGKAAISSVSPMVTLKFKALASGMSDVIFAEKTKAAAEGYADNVITSKTDAKVTVK